MKRIIFLCITFFAAFVLLTVYCNAETISLKSGQKIEGDIVEITQKYIKIDVGGVPMTYFVDELEDASAYFARIKPAGDKPVKKILTPYELKSDVKKTVLFLMENPEYRQAILLSSQEKYKAAAEIFQKLLKGDTPVLYSAAALKIIADMDNEVIDQETCRLLFQGENSVLEGKTEDALSFLKAALEKNSDYAEGNAELGKMYLTMEQYKLAELYLLRAVELDAANPIFYLALGGAQVSLEQYKDARANLMKAAAIFKKAGNEKMVKEILSSVASFPKQ